MDLGLKRGTVCDGERGRAAIGGCAELELDEIGNRTEENRFVDGDTDDADDKLRDGVDDRGTGDTNCIPIGVLSAGVELLWDIGETDD